jgi:hypothetical protein
MRAFLLATATAAMLALRRFTKALIQRHCASSLAVAAYALQANVENLTLAGGNHQWNRQ